MPVKLSFSSRNIFHGIRVYSTVSDFIVVAYNLICVKVCVVKKKNEFTVVSFKPFAP